jgi:hypothetical protein
MSVTSVSLHSQGTSGNASGSDKEATKAAYRSMYRVKCSSPLDTVDEVLKHFRITASLPWIGRRFKFGNGFNTSVFCKDVQADYVDKSDGIFVVGCKFESLEGNKGGDQGGTISGDASDNPLKWHDEISVSYQNITIPVEEATLWGFTKLGVDNPNLKKGYKGAVVSSAMTPLDPTLEDDTRIQVVRITKFLPSYNGDQYTPYLDCINNDRFTINKPQYGFRLSVGLYKAKFGSVSTDFGITSGIKYYRQTAELLISTLPYGWLRLVVDRDVKRLIGPGKKNDAGVTISPGDDQSERLKDRKIFTSHLKDDYGYPLTTPVRFNGEGDPLDPKDKTVHMIWQTKQLKSFAALRW